MKILLEAKGKYICDWSGQRTIRYIQKLFFITEFTKPWRFRKYNQKWLFRCLKNMCLTFKMFLYNLYTALWLVNDWNHRYSFIIPYFFYSVQVHWITIRNYEIGSTQKNLYTPPPPSLYKTTSYLQTIGKILRYEHLRTETYVSQEGSRVEEGHNSTLGPCTYRPFLNILPRSSAFLNWISVRFYETGCR